MTDMEPIKLSCSLCGADWDGHDVCPVQRAWILLYFALSSAILSLVAVLTYAVMWR